MESLHQLAFDGIEPGTPAGTTTHTAQAAAAQERYRATAGGKAQNRKHQLAWRARQGDALRQKDRIRVRDYTRQKKYGLSPEAFEAMFVEQGGVCAVCKSAEHRGKSWHVDHDHATGKVRGILCAQCNVMIGYAHDSPAPLIAAAEYLVKHGK